MYAAILAKRAFNTDSVSSECSGRNKSCVLTAGGGVDENSKLPAYIFRCQFWLH